MSSLYIPLQSKDRLCCKEKENEIKSNKNRDYSNEVYKPCRNIWNCFIGTNILFFFYRKLNFYLFIRLFLPICQCDLMLFYKPPARKYELGGGGGERKEEEEVKVSKRGDTRKRLLEKK